MMIYSMTATFGKLEHETLTLEPGLNVLCAPNEWGKSTWCAFLLAMLYGLDTRAKTTRAALADKERYAPWSGSPMEGRIDLNWNGRDITIERSTKGRIPLGTFRAYETKSGAEVPELNASNCGQQLLGVEQSVFRRTGFIRLSDLPVTQDEALRNRLNALVTTGDESGDALRLGQSLRDLKNRCRYNRSGLLPQAVQQKEELEGKLAQWTELENRLRLLQERQEENELLLKELENHKKWIAYREARADESRVAQARENRDEEVRRMETLERTCAALPARETVEDKCRLLRELNGRYHQIQSQLAELAPEPERPQAIKAFRDLTPEDAVKMADEDEEEFESQTGKGWLILMILGMFCLVTAGALACLRLYVPAVLDLVVGAGSFVLGLYRRMTGIRLEQEFMEKYGTLESVRWNSMACAYGLALRGYEKERRQRQTLRTELEEQRETLQKQCQALCEQGTPEETLEQWQQILTQWEDFFKARRDAVAAEKHLEDLMAMAKRGQAPEIEDTMTLTAEETEEQLNLAREEQRTLHSRREQQRGRMESLGDHAGLSRELEKARLRVARLEDTYAALTIAQQTLADAMEELQRRFAPPITRRAQQLLADMTEGRYDRLVISGDFSLRSGAVQEDTLHDALWRSDGTVDQLYLALRLAVSQELAPEAPLILDDALARFDDRRMQAAVDILRDLAREKQIILFTCQQRERLAAEKA